MPRRGKSLTNDVGRDRNGVEVYLSEDILQGDEVPFFIRWREPNVKSVSLSTKGFAGISRIYNVTRTDLPTTTLSIQTEDLSAPGYLGGALATVMSKKPDESGQLDVRVELKNGRSDHLLKHRILHSARLHLTSTPGIASLPLASDYTPALVEVRGRATVAIDITQSSSSEIDLVLPSEIRSAFEKFTEAVLSGMDRLKEEFPHRSELIDDLFDLKEGQSLRQYYESVSTKIENFKHDKSFIEAFALVFVGALLGQTSVKDTLFLPFLEYLEANASSKVFLRSPFLSAKVRSGKGRLSFEIVGQDLRGRNCGDPVKVHFVLESEKDLVIPVKDLIRFRRVP